MKFELRISSYGGLVAGARHYRGRIQGEHPKSCHGGMIFQGGHKDPEVMSDLNDALEAMD